MSSISTAEAKGGVERLLSLAQHEPVYVRDGERDLAVIISPEAYGRLLAARQRMSPNPLIMELFQKSVAERGAVYEALAR